MSETEGISDSSWEMWNSKSGEDDYRVTDKVIWNENHEISVKILAPLGRGISGSVFAVQVVECEKQPTIVSTMLCLKIFKTNSVAISQAENEILILPLTHRNFNTGRFSVFPSYLTSFKIDGHLGFLMELGGPSLFHGLSMRKNKGFPLSAVRTILIQILKGLAEMENKGLVHGDIKPENIIFSLRKAGNLTSFEAYKNAISNLSFSIMRDEFENQDVLNISLIDWSSSSMGYNQNAQYMQSRYYRAPEILMRSSYGPGVDIWSTACVAVELFIGKPLFPGADELDMIRIIQQRLGIFPHSVIRKMGSDSIAASTDEWMIDPKNYLPGNFEAFICEESRRQDNEVLLFINLMRLMLQLNPDARASASSALSHPFITGNMKQNKRIRRDSAFDNRKLPLIEIQNARRCSIKGSSLFN